MQIINLEKEENELGDNLHTNYQNMLHSLGNLESRIIKLYQQIEILKKEKNSLHDNLVSTEQEFQQYIENIGLKYGSGKLDFVNGTLTID
jgi:chromosome segregation ATPase